MAGNLDPFTPTILSSSTCDLGCVLSTRGELAGGTNLAQTTEIEQGKTDDLRLSSACHGVIDDISRYQHTHADLTRGEI